MTRVLACPRMALCPPPSRTLRAAGGGGLKAILCAGHVQQSGGESPLCNLMEVKHE
jgi:hypothetical protein